MRRGFVFTGIAFLMAIPAVILAASFVSMLETGNAAVITQVSADKTFSTYENVEKDLSKSLRIGGRRGAIGIVDYISVYDECINSSTYNNAYGTGAEGALRELLLEGNITSVSHTHNPEIMEGNTLTAWADAYTERAKALGFDVDVGEMPPSTINITPVTQKSFYVYFKVNATIREGSNSSYYNSTIPRSGPLIVFIDGEDLQYPIFNCTSP